MLKLKIRLNNYQKIALAYIIIIMIGAALLYMPIATKEGSTPFIDAIFTATSAVCVTGLVVFDTYTHWSLFGQIVILVLIQIGGIGFMTIMTLFAIFIKKQLSLHEKCLFMHSTGAYEVGSTVKIIKQMTIGTIIFESIGAALLSFVFIPKMGFVEGFYNAVFHSISAFCNAGFDIMGKYGPFTSLTTFAGNPLVTITVMFLIIAGGIGFLVWNDLIRNKFRWSKYSLHTKLVIATSLILIALGALLLLLFEFNHSMSGMRAGERILAALFHSVTPRTAGFNTLDINSMSQSGKVLTKLLMLIGGNPGSTAGGIKTTTIAVLVLAVIASVNKKNGLRIFKRRLEDGVTRQAAAIMMLYCFVIIFATFIICAIQSFDIYDVFFETTSAIGTVGLSTGIIPMFNTWSKLIIIFLMYAGKVGMLSIAMSFVYKKMNVIINRPIEKIIIG